MNLGPMAHGTDSGGKYDEEVTAARDATGAALALLIIVGGKNGTGFSAQCIDGQLMQLVPQLLRGVADEIERGQLQ